MAEDAEKQNEGLEVRTYFVRGRNALVARADFGELYVDHYLRLADQKIRYSPREDVIFKDALAALTLHCASLPQSESVAWTMNFQDPLLNVFVAGDNPAGRVIGRAFSEGVKEGASNLFYSDAVGSAPLRRSMLPFTGSDVFSAVQAFYDRSEQRPGRLFRHGEEDIILVSAQPDMDMDWFNGLDDAAVREMDQKETLSLLEKRHYHWECGCSEAKILQAISGILKQGVEEFFQGEDTLRVSCPRCGVRYLITREAAEAFVAQDKPRGNGG